MSERFLKTVEGRIIRWNKYKCQAEGIEEVWGHFDNGKFIQESINTPDDAPVMEEAEALKEVPDRTPPKPIKISEKEEKAIEEIQKSKRGGR